MSAISWAGFLNMENLLFILRAASLAQAPLPTKKTFAMHTLPVEWLTE
jgi:hypothetical protein